MALLLLDRPTFPRKRPHRSRLPARQLVPLRCIPSMKTNVAVGLLPLALSFLFTADHPSEGCTGSWTEFRQVIFSVNHCGEGQSGLSHRSHVIMSEPPLLHKGRRVTTFSRAPRRPDDTANPRWTPARRRHRGVPPRANADTIRAVSSGHCWSREERMLGGR